MLHRTIVTSGQSEERSFAVRTSFKNNRLHPGHVHSTRYSQQVLGALGPLHCLRVCSRSGRICHAAGFPVKRHDGLQRSLQDNRISFFSTRVVTGSVTVSGMVKCLPIVTKVLFVDIGVLERFVDLSCQVDTFFLGSSIPAVNVGSEV